MTIRQDIYAALEKFLEPAPLPAPWNHLPAPRNYRAPLRDYNAAARSLRERFSDNDLLSSRVLTRKPGVGGASPRFGIHPYLHVGNLLLLRHHRDEPPYDFVSTGGCVSGLPPVLAALHDAATQRLVELSGETLFATFGIQSAAILQALKYPAMPAAGLATIKGRHLAQLCRVLDVRSLSRAPWDESDFGVDDDDSDPEVDGAENDDDDCDSASDSLPSPSAPLPPPTCHPSPHQRKPAAGAPLPTLDPPAVNPEPSPQPDTPRRQNEALQEIRLCLVAWHPALLSLVEPEKFAEIDAHLRQLAAQLELLMDNIYVWRPDPSLSEKLRCALTCELPTRILSIIESSYKRSTHPLIPRDPASTHPPPTLRERYDELRQGKRDGLKKDVDQVQEMCQSFDQQIIDPLLDAVEAEPDLALKAQKLAQALNYGQQLYNLTQLAVPESPKQGAARGTLRPEDIEHLQAKQELAMDSLNSVDPSSQPASRSRRRPSRR